MDAANKMDAKPFFEFNILDIKDQNVEELKKFSKSAFDINNIVTTASSSTCARASASLLSSFRRLLISTLDELYKQADRLKSTVARYDALNNGAQKPTTEKAV